MVGGALASAAATLRRLAFVLLLKIVQVAGGKKRASFYLAVVGWCSSGAVARGVAWTAVSQ